MTVPGKKPVDLGRDKGRDHGPGLRHALTRRPVLSLTREALAGCGAANKPTPSCACQDNPGSQPTLKAKIEAEIANVAKTRAKRNVLRSPTVHKTSVNRATWRAAL